MVRSGIWKYIFGNCFTYLVKYNIVIFLCRFGSFCFTSYLSNSYDRYAKNCHSSKISLVKICLIHSQNEMVRSKLTNGWGPNRPTVEMPIDQWLRSELSKGSELTKVQIVHRKCPNWPRYESSKVINMPVSSEMAKRFGYNLPQICCTWMCFVSCFIIIIWKAQWVSQ